MQKDTVHLVSRQRYNIHKSHSLIWSAAKVRILESESEILFRMGRIKGNGHKPIIHRGQFTKNMRELPHRGDKQLDRL